ncbi:unnamed protein product [Aphis gossypii]|uniref:Uncharacterized protein n=1 Tax=Aphis gossypii TaxID=80765 RepID=A0A9P0JAI7_APHGO|nr:unnamed protein product [Aphis gossypii]
MCDGWTNIRRESIINYVITTPQPLFYKTSSTGAESHTAIFIAKEISVVLNEVGPKKVLGIVTDNAKNMKGAWKILQEKYNHLQPYGCVAHGLNLLAKDISSIESIAIIVNKGKEIVKEIIFSHRLDAIFKEKQVDKKITLKLPVCTRWGSHVIFLNSIIKNRSALRSVAIDERAEYLLSNTTKIQLLDDTFWNTTTQLYDILKPISNWITQIESDTPQLSLVPTIFMDIKNNFEQILTPSHILYDKTSRIMSFLKKRTDFCTKSIHKAAHLLDPMLKEKNLMPEEEMEGIECISNVARYTDNIDEATVLAEFAQYKVKEGLWSKEFVWNTVNKVSATTWWNGLCSSSQLSKIATKILQLPPTSAACERTFSSYSNIHTVKRNCLTNDRAGKLVYINHNLRLLQKNLENKPTTVQTVPSLITSTSSEEHILDIDTINVNDSELSGNSSSNMSVDTFSYNQSDSSSAIVSVPKNKKKRILESDSSIDDIQEDCENQPQKNSTVNQQEMIVTDDHINMTTLKVGDFIVIEMSSKKTTKQYIGLIEQKVSCSEYCVKFMKKKPSTNSFIFPLIEETSSITVDEIKCVLGTPTIGRRELYTFSDDLSKFQNLY